MISLRDSTKPIIYDLKIVVVEGSPGALSVLGCNGDEFIVPKSDTNNVHVSLMIVRKESFAAFIDLGIWKTS